MRAISLWQPWASLVATNWKHYETRSWQTPYRGPLVICAAKRIDDLDYWFNQPEFRRHLIASGIKHYVDLPLGKALCIVNLVDIFQTEHIRHRLDATERAFGNYEDGRFAWKLDFDIRFINPFPVRGSQGLFNVDLPNTVKP